METKEYAKFLLEKYDISIFSKEVEIFNLLNKIVDSKQDAEIDLEKLKMIEKHLDDKLKLQRTEKFNNFLEKLARNLEFQRIRKTDKGEEDFEVINFKVKDIDNKEYVFLTRKYLEEYIDKHKDKFKHPNIIKIETQENVELNMLLDMIIKNFINEK